MTTDKSVMADAAKLRSLTYRGMGEWRTPDGECLDVEQVHELRAVLASDWLERFQPDDDEAISETWLRDYAHLAFTIRARFERGMDDWAIEAWHEGDLWTFVMVGPHGELKSQITNPTRRQFISLCAVCGIPLKESPNAK